MLVRPVVGFAGCTQLCRNLDGVACSDLYLEGAQAKAAQWHIAKACSTDALLADPEIELVVNLTIPKLHADVNLQALAAGKHVYVEKPLPSLRMMHSAY